MTGKEWSGLAAACSVEELRLGRVDDEDLTAPLLTAQRQHFAVENDRATETRDGNNEGLGGRIC